MSNTKFNLSIDLFTRDVRDAGDVAAALRGVAARLDKFASSTWSPYALTGTIYASDGSKRPIGTWSVDSEAEVGLKLTITAENDPDSRVHCATCGNHIPNPKALTSTVCDKCEGTADQTLPPDARLTGHMRQKLKLAAIGLDKKRVP